jgi:outer membrane lipoprotein-sorting protein
MQSFTAAPTRRAFLGTAIGAALLTASKTRAAAPPPPPALSVAEQADLHRIEAYLNGIKTLEGKFQQTAADGAVTTGKVWLSRPGKMRLEYDPPAKLLLVCNDDLVAVEDKSLHNVQYFPIDETPVWFLLRDHITLTGDVTVTRFERGLKTLRLTATQTKDQAGGALTLVLADDPLTLKQWTVLDPQGRAVTVALIDVRDGGQLSSELFRLPSNVDQRPHVR